MTIKDAIDNYGQSLNISPEIVELINTCNQDLYCGPVYFDKNGDECSCFDEGAKQFNFQAACTKIAEAMSEVSDLWIDTQCDGWSTKEPQGEEFEGEWVEPCWEDWMHVERIDVLKRLVGEELARYVQ